MGTNELKFCKVKKKYFELGRIEQLRREKNILYLHDKPKEPTKEEPLTCVLFASPFTSVSTFSRGHPSLVSFYWKRHKSFAET
jgi:hypothetical protein